MGMFFLPKDVILSAGFQAIWIFNIGQIKSVPQVSMGKILKCNHHLVVFYHLQRFGWLVKVYLLSIHLEKKRVKLGSPKSPVQWLSLLHKEMLFKRLNNWSTMLHFLIQAEINFKKYISKFRVPTSISSISGSHCNKRHSFVLHEIHPSILRNTHSLTPTTAVFFQRKTGLHVWLPEADCVINFVDIYIYI